MYEALKRQIKSGASGEQASVVVALGPAVCAPERIHKTRGKNGSEISGNVPV